jgi:DNA polymerase/3'-5' exonuclease PolX
MAKNKQDVIEMLDEMASLLQFEGANPFKIRAFENAVRALETYSMILIPWLPINNFKPFLA